MIKRYHGSSRKAQKTFKRPKTILKHLLEFYEKNPRNWATHSRDVLRTSATGGHAYCLLGGVEAFAADEAAFDAAVEVLGQVIPEGIVTYNDHRKSVKPIINRLKKAIA